MSQLICPKCQSANVPGAKFCINCGNTMAGVLLEPSPVVQPLPGQQVLPNATAVLVLGIISITGCFCYGIVGIILGIIALVLANSASAQYKKNPGAYLESSFKNMNAGRVCAIVGLCLSSAYIIFLIIYVLVLGATFVGLPWMEKFAK